MKRLLPSLMASNSALMAISTGDSHSTLKRMLSGAKMLLSYMLEMMSLLCVVISDLSMSEAGLLKLTSNVIGTSLKE